METIDKTFNRFFSSVGFKLGLIAILTLLLLIPASMISSLISEREERRDETIKEVTSIWGNEQTLSGPVLTIPVKTTEETSQDDFKTVTKYVHILPENLKVEGSVEPKVRNRGIYKVVTYRARLHVTGSFPAVDLSELHLGPDDFENSMGWIEIGIPDMRGINQEINFSWGDTVVPMIPGIPSNEISTSGIHCEVPLTRDAEISFAFDLDLNGSHSLNFVPLGKETTISLASSWNSPSFKGAFLPDDRKLTKKGFTATWNVLQLNRNYPQQWTGNQYSIGESVFGVDLITPVDTYQKSMRSVKYAVLFIGLTFLVFFFSEVFTKVRIHAVNYLLTGFALCVFYSLLTSIAEHLSFTIAYCISSFTIIAMIATFAWSLFKSARVTLSIVLSLIALYVFLFVILQLMDYSLLFGNIGLIAILGLVMYFSRKIDWYSPVRNTDKE
jgi:inner membrane protein